jgi:hypothetical protein
MRRVHETIVAVEKQYYTCLCVRVFARAVQGMRVRAFVPVWVQKRGLVLARV